MLFWKKESQILAKTNGSLKMDFKNLEIDIEDLPNFENAGLKPISRKYGWIIIFNWFLFSTILLCGIIILKILEKQYITDTHFINIYFSYIFSGAVLFLIINYIISYFNFFTKKYAIRTHDIIYQHGLIKTTTTIIPFNRIQHVDLEEGWLSRILEIKSISIYTAGQNSGDIKINGLEKDLSKNINQFILNKIKAEQINVETLNITEVSQNEF